MTTSTSILLHMFLTVGSSLMIGSKQVSIKCDIHIYIVTVNGVLPLSLVQSDPHLVLQPQLQHDALTLHDRPVTGLGVDDRLLTVIQHNVQVCLLEVPRVNVDIEEVDAWDDTHELSLKHVKMFIHVDEDSVKNQRLVCLEAVEGFAAAH